MGQNGFSFGRLKSHQQALKNEVIQSVFLKKKNFWVD